MAKLLLGHKYRASLVEEVNAVYRQSCMSAALLFDEHATISDRSYTAFRAGAADCFVGIAKLILSGHNVRLTITDASDDVDLAEGMGNGTDDRR